MDGLKDLAAVKQQIALNSRMFEAGRITRCLHNRTHDILLDRLTEIYKYDTIIDEELIGRSKMI